MENKKKAEDFQRELVTLLKAHGMEIAFVVCGDEERFYPLLQGDVREVAAALVYEFEADPNFKIALTEFAKRKFPEGLPG